MSQTRNLTRDPAGRDAAREPAAGAAGRGKAAIRRANLARLLRPVLMIGGVLLVVVVALLFWLAGGRYASSDDTYVDAAKVSLSTDVSGLVGQVFVQDNQHVAAGQKLFALDQASFVTAVEDARAQLGQAALDVASAKRGYAEAVDEVATQKVQIANDQADLARYASVVANGGVTRAVYDDARYKLLGDQARLGQLSDEGGVQLAKLNGDANIAVGDVPEYQRAQAQLQDAERDLNDSVMRAPFSGTVSQTEQLQPGMFLAAGTAAFGLVSDTDVWITAQPKESDLTWVRPGQTATITVDSYPGRQWRGVVDSISPASGGEFSILPAQNSSGNWVKVVQRIPVRIKITSGPAGLAPADVPLRDGMSTEVSIDTHHARHLSDLF